MKPSNGIPSHLLPTSATMVGVCMTVISIGKIAHHHAGMVIDRMRAAVVSVDPPRPPDDALRALGGNPVSGALGLVSVTSVALAFELL